jgi:hypothetical protein
MQNAENENLQRFERRKLEEENSLNKSMNFYVQALESLFRVATSSTVLRLWLKRASCPLFGTQCSDITSAMLSCVVHSVQRTDPTNDGASHPYLAQHAGP